MRTKLLLFAALALAVGTAADQAASQAADRTTLDRGQKVEQTTCLPCHSLRLIHSQRLPRATWDKELTKMAGWGWSAKPEDRAALLEFLVANYGDDKPAAPPEKSDDGRK
jgi:mono/diheme cytochrome c family protein